MDTASQGTGHFSDWTACAACMLQTLPFTCIPMQYYYAPVCMQHRLHVSPGRSPAILIAAYGHALRAIECHIHLHRLMPAGTLQASFVQKALRDSAKNQIIMSHYVIHDDSILLSQCSAGIAFMQGRSQADEWIHLMEWPKPSGRFFSTRIPRPKIRSSWMACSFGPRVGRGKVSFVMFSTAMPEASTAAATELSSSRSAAVKWHSRSC